MTLYYFAKIPKTIERKLKPAAKAKGISIERQAVDILRDWKPSKR